MCHRFSLQYSIKFNCSKFQLVIHKCKNSKFDLLPIHLKIGDIDITPQENAIHLGHVIGESACKTMIGNAVNDLYIRTNILLSKFSHCQTSVRYTLFRTYCMSIYGSNIWNLSSPDCERFYVAWRKCVKRVLSHP